MMAMRTIAALAGLMPLVKAITPEQMLAAPRRGTANVNPSGDWAVFTSTSYNWTSGRSTTTWNLLNVNTANISELSFGPEVSEIVWLGDTDTSILYINGTSDETPGGVSLYVADLGTDEFTPTLVGDLGGPYSGLKAVQTESGDINFLVYAKAYANNGTVYNEELATTPRSTARLYDSIYVRHWDTYLTQERYAVFSGVLTSGDDNSFSLNEQPKNLLFGLEYNVTRPETPVQPFGDAGDYDISPDGSQVIFLTKAPELPKANYTASYIYLVPHDASSAPVAINGPGSKAPAQAQGASNSPVFSPDGTKVAYGQMAGVFYESDHIDLYVADLASGEITQLVPDWDYSASVIRWGKDGSDLYIGADYLASTKLFIVPLDSDDAFIPTNITDITSIADMTIIDDGALISSSAVWSSRNFYTVTPTGSTNVLFQANEVDPELAGLGPDDYEEMWYTGYFGESQHAVVVKPTDFDPTQSYPLVFYVHGGPQGYTGNTWSTRWNLRTWADQGYVLVGPNPTGSTSFGQQLTDNITNNWGSYPYYDLVNAFNHISESGNYPYINVSNAVEAGASYGGFMTFWIAGQELGKKFKAQVSHDGKVCASCSYQTEELWFVNKDNNGTYLDAPENYERFDPLDYAGNWTTPMFVVHSDLDYRLAVGEGLLAFNLLQSKGVPSRFLNFPDENHWVQNRENSLVWHKEIYNWINYWTGKTDSLSDNAIKM